MRILYSVLMSVISASGAHAQIGQCGCDQRCINFISSFVLYDQCVRECASLCQECGYVCHRAESAPHFDEGDQITNNYISPIQNENHSNYPLRNNPYKKEDDDFYSVIKYLRSARDKSSEIGH